LRNADSCAELRAAALQRGEVGNGKEGTEVTTSEKTRGDDLLRVSCSGVGCLSTVLLVALALLLCAQWDAINIALSRWLTGAP
jgi:hypothetical protein